MRIHGWCAECRHPVSVSGHGLAAAASGAVPTGVCDACEREADVRRRITARYGQTWQADIRIAAELVGLRVRSLTHDPGHGYSILLEDGRELEAATPTAARALLARTPRRR